MATPAEADVARSPERGRIASVLALFALAGLAIAGYLTVTRLAGELPACGPLAGCEQVATSPYSVILGIPVSVLGVAYSTTILALVVAWWRTGTRVVLLAGHGLGIAGVVMVAYLTWLELFVIEAVCAWCVAYAVIVVCGWAVSALALRR